MLEKKKSFKSVKLEEISNDFDQLIRDIDFKISHESFKDIEQLKLNINSITKELQACCESIEKIHSLRFEFSLIKQYQILGDCKSKFSQIEERKKKVKYLKAQLSEMQRRHEEMVQQKLFNYNDPNLDNDNDLSEKLLFDQAKQNLTKVAMNLNDAQLGLYNQRQTIHVINKETMNGGDLLQSSDKMISSIDNRKFLQKLILHLTVLVLFIGIIAVFLLKLFFKKNNS